jgi:hypothetical protein
VGPRPARARRDPEQRHGGVLGERDAVRERLGELREQRLVVRPGPGRGRGRRLPRRPLGAVAGRAADLALNAAGPDPSITLNGAADLEGGVVADSQTTTKAHFFGGNGSVIRGPVIGQVGDIAGDGKAKAFAFVPAGSAIGGTTTYTLGTPCNFN